MKYMPILLTLFCFTASAQDKIKLQNLIKGDFDNSSVYKFVDGKNTCYLSSVYGGESISCVEDK